MKKPTPKKTIQEEPKTPYGMSQQNFKIYLRIKPIQNEQGSNQILKIHNTSRVEIISPYYTVTQTEKMYTFEQIFDGGVNNQEVFTKTMINPIQNVLQGYNSTVFIYGMTGAGKTYTMFGSIGSGTSTGLKTEEQGLVTMTIDYIFKEIQKEQNIKSQIIVSFYEIYNENIRDLLQQQQIPLIIMEDPIHGVFINGLLEVPAEDKNHIKDVIFSGLEKRSMNSTKSNEVSSRSHAILQFTVRRYISDSNTNQVSVLESKFFMIDLAGNQKTYHNQSRRFIEGVNINKSLLTLGKCLSVLAQKKGAYVPFRDSKLTRILKQSLGGNSKTVMIACVSPDKKFYEQTLNTLKYSSIAKRIKNRGVKHNVRIISKDQIPDNKSFIKSKQKLTHQKWEHQGKIKNIINEFMNAVQVKTKIERLQEDLELSLKQNEDLMQVDQSQYENCRKNVNKINETLKQLMRPYEKQLERVNRTYHQLMTSIEQISLQGNKENEPASNYQSEVSQLKHTIAEQNKKLEEYASKYGSLESNAQNEQFTLNANRSVDCQWQHSNSSSPQFHKQNSLPSINFLPVEKSTKNVSKAKKLTINCQQQVSQSLPLQPLNTSNLSLNSCQDKKIMRLQKQIVINLGKGECKGQQSNRDQFVKRLKQTQKKAKAAQSDEITSLLEEHENNRYELGNTELSMIRKLRFFQREKSRQKSNSLSKLFTKSQSSTKSLFRKF